jgi:hypothetical protein
VTAVDRPDSWRHPENCGRRRDGAVGWRSGEAARLESPAADGDEADPTCSPQRWGRGRREQGTATLAVGKGDGRGDRASGTMNGGTGGGEGRRRGTLALASHGKGTRGGKRSETRGGASGLRGMGVFTRWRFFRYSSEVTGAFS